MYNNRAVRDEVNRVMANPEINGKYFSKKYTGEKMIIMHQCSFIGANEG
jgi:hypothetical protein